MSLTRPLLVAAIILTSTIGDSQAQFATFHPQINVAGTFNNEETMTPNMQVVGPNLWQAYIEMKNETDVTFQFATPNFTNNWGDNDPPGTNLPLVAIGEPGGAPIAIAGTLDGTYKFRFDSSNRAYSVRDTGDFTSTDSVWINELHYDNVSADTNEGFEIAGDSGSDLSNYQVYLYKDDGTFYRKLSLSGVIPNETLGYGALWFPISGMQNGPADGIALVTNEAAVIQFLSYEGVLTAIEGPATGMTSVDIGVAESPAPAVGMSLQLIGLGAQYRQFTWSGPDTQSRGLLNAGQTMVPPTLPASVQVTDLSTLPVGPSEDESVDLSVRILPANGASNIVAHAFYRLPDAASFTPIPMSASDGTNYTTVSSIPGQPAGAIVDYYIHILFDGDGTSSPTLFPADGTFYGISSVPFGDVWINELNYLGTLFDDIARTNEFIEIAGVAGVDLSQWSIELHNLAGLYATYTFPEPTGLLNDGDGFGFFVFGDENVPNVDIVLTNLISGEQNLADRGAVILVSEFGIPVMTLTYGDPEPTNFASPVVYAGFDDDFVFDEASLGSTGTASNGVDLTYTSSPTSSGQANEGQTLENGNTNSLLPIIICPDDLTLQCLNEVPPADPNDVLATGFCGDTSVLVTLLTASTNSGTGCLGSPLVISRTYQAVSDCATTATCTQVISVEDTTPPVIDCSPRLLRNPSFEEGDFRGWSRFGIEFADFSLSTDEPRTGFIHTSMSMEQPLPFSYRDTVLALNPIAYYTFDTDDVFGSQVGNRGSLRNPATLSNDATFTGETGGFTGGGLDIDNDTDQYLRIDAGVIELGTEWTLSTWFNNLHDSDQWRTLTRGSRIDHQVIVGPPGSNNLGTFRNGAGNFYDSNADLLPGDTTWHHLAAVASGGQTSFYLDGVLVGTSAAASSSDILSIGNFWERSQPFAQTIDEFAVFGTALTEEEIALLVNVTPCVRGQFVRVTNPADEGTLHLRELEVYSEGVNVALAGTATQSSTLNNDEANWGAFKVIDGVITTTDNPPSGRNINHTEDTANDEWVEIDLGASVKIDEIHLYNRISDSTRLNNYTVEVLDAGGFVVWSEGPNPTPPGDFASFEVSDPGCGGASDCAVPVTDGLVLWLDGRDIDGAGDGTIGDPTAGDNVANWVDKAGGDNNANGVVGTVTVSSAEMLNGEPVVNFASGSRLNLAASVIAQGSTAIVVYRQTPGVDNRWANILGGNLHTKQPNENRTLTIGGGSINVGSSKSVQVWGIQTMQLEAGNYQLWVDGALQGTHTTTSTGFIPFNNLGDIGGADVAEVLIYDRSLGDAERLIVEAYLTDKYFGEGCGNTGGDTGGGGNQQVGLYQDLPAVPGEEWLGLAYLQNPGIVPLGSNDLARVELQFLDSSSQVVQTVESAPLTSDSTLGLYLRCLARATAPAGTVTARLRVLLELEEVGVNNPILYLDDAILTPNAVYTSDGSGCSAPAPDLTAVVIADDNCSAPILTQQPIPGTLLMSESNLIVVTASDCGGLQAQCTAQLEVIDDTPPFVDNPATVLEIPVNAACIVSMVDIAEQVAASDNCTPSSEIVVTASALPGQRVSVGTTVPVLIVMLDAAGNFGTNVIAVTGIDDTDPVITETPPDMVVECSASIDPETLGIAIASDNCSNTGIVIMDDPFSFPDDLGAGGPTLGGAAEPGDAGGWGHGPGAWEIIDGVLTNANGTPATGQDRSSEGSVAKVVDLTGISGTLLDQLTLSFDYMAGDASETLVVHLWGYVENATPSSRGISPLNTSAINGSAWEISREPLDPYNLGQLDGVWTPCSVRGQAACAAVTLTATNGTQTFRQTFDLFANTLSPNNIADYDYLVIGFSRNASGAGLGIDNVKLTASANIDPCGTTILPDPASATASTEFSGSFAVENLYDGAVTPDDVGTGDNQGAEYAGVATGPHVVVYDMGLPSVFDAVFYAQRHNTVVPLSGKVGQIEFWVTDSDPGAASVSMPLLTGPADYTLDVINVFNGDLTQYNLGTSLIGQYVVMRLTAEPGSSGDPGGYELVLGSSPCGIVCNEPAASLGPGATLDLDTFTALDGGGPRLNVSLANHAALDAKTYQVNNFAFRATVGGNIIPFLAVRTGTGPSTYSTVWVGPSITPATDQADSVTYAPGETFTLSAPAEIYAGVYHDGGSKVYLSAGGPTDHDNNTITVPSFVGQELPGGNGWSVESWGNGYAIRCDISGCPAEVRGGSGLLDLTSQGATSDGVTGNSPGFAEVKAFDNDHNSRWASWNVSDGDPTAEDWIYVDLGRSYRIDRVDIDWHASFGLNYGLYTFDDIIPPDPDSDLGSWTLIGTTSNRAGVANLAPPDFDEEWDFNRGTVTFNSGTGTGSSLLSGTGRWLMLHGTPNGGDLMSIREIDIYGTTPCPGDASLVAHWTFDNAAEVGQALISSDLETVGDAAYSPAGRFGGALSLDGDGDYLRVDASESLPGGLPTGDSSYTLSAWILTSTSGGLGIIGWGNYGTPGEVNAFRTGTDSLVNYGWSSSYDYSVGGLGINDGTWHHVAATYDSATSTKHLYVDGTKVGSGKVIPDLAVGAANFALARASGTEYFNGLIDEVRVYDAALDDTEVSGLYSCYDATMMDPGDSESAAEITHEDLVTTGSCPGERLVTRIWTATDESGNSAISTQIITMVDSTAPTASNPESIMVDCLAGAPAPDILVVTNEADNCTAEPVVEHVSDVSDGMSCPETISRTYSVTDDCGNSMIVTQVITLVDTDPPTASNPTPLTVECSAGAPTPDISVVTNEADNCTASPTVAYLEDISDGMSCPETISRTYSVTDECDNSITVTQMITVADTTAPTASNPAPLTVECSAGAPAPDISVVTDEADNCTSTPVVAHVSDVSDGGPCPEVIMRTYSITDGCGNSNTVTQIITLQGGGGTAPMVEIIRLDFEGTDFRVNSIGNNTWDLVLEWNTNVDPQIWTPIESFSNRYMNGTNTTTFPNPAPQEPVMYFRVWQNEL